MLSELYTEVVKKKKSDEIKLQERKVSNEVSVLSIVTETKDSWASSVMILFTHLFITV